VRVAVTGKPTPAAIAILAVLVPLSLAFIALMYAVLLAWYIVVFGLFGLLTIPFRFFRRGHRKQLAVQQQQLDVSRQILAEQQRARELNER